MSDDVMQRAFEAYFDSADDLCQPAHYSEVERHGGHEYAVLRNTRGVLAVFWVAPSGRLVHLDESEWPRGIEHTL